MRRRRTLLGDCGPDCHCPSCVQLSDSARLEYDQRKPEVGTVGFEYDRGPVYPLAPPRPASSSAVGFVYDDGIQYDAMTVATVPTATLVSNAADPHQEPAQGPGRFRYDQGFYGLGMESLPSYDGNVLYLQTMINRFSSWLAFAKIDEDGISGPDTLLRSQQLVAFLGGDPFLFQAVVGLVNSPTPYHDLLQYAVALATSLDAYANAHNLSDSTPKADKATMEQVITAIHQAGVSDAGIDSGFTWWMVAGLVFVAGAVALIFWKPTHHRARA